MTCTRCGDLVVMIRRWPDCSCNQAPPELVERERARLARGVRLLVRSGTFWRCKDKGGTGGHAWGILANAERYHEFKTCPYKRLSCVDWLGCLTVNVPRTHLFFRC